LLDIYWNIPYDCENKGRFCPFSVCTFWFWHWRHSVFSVREELNTYIEVRRTLVSVDLPWLRRSVASLSLRRPRFIPRSVRVRFMVDIVTQGQAFLQELWSSRVSIIPPVLYPLFVYMLFLPGQNRRSLEASQKIRSLPELRDHLVEKHFHFF